MGGRYYFDGGFNWIIQYGVKAQFSIRPAVTIQISMLTFWLPFLVSSLCIFHSKCSVANKFIQSAVVSQQL
uniref:Uncharacterized protein n=1 Tax=Anguilla anguilla TaxID=7936 RepID=A0A0E9XZN6_ANGAN